MYFQNIQSQKYFYKLLKIKLKYEHELGKDGHFCDSLFLILGQSNPNKLEFCIENILCMYLIKTRDNKNNFSSKSFFSLHHTMFSAKTIDKFVIP